MIHFQRIRSLLREFQFQNVFRELGWGNPPRIAAPEFQADGAHYRFTPIAEQGGLHAFEVSNLTEGSIPPRATQLDLKRQLTPLFAEHFLVFVNSARTSSLWLWVWRNDKTSRPVDQRFDRIQSGELLLQKLSGLFFDYADLDDDGKASIGQVLDRLQAQFYAEKVTKRFYEDFRKYKDRFITFIQGIESLDNRKWYASVILNRLMFIYFIQQKRFLSGDPQYLQNKFEHCEDNGLNYYQDFLCPLFFQGFALRPGERDAATSRLLGTVPYLNGGLFLEHAQLEAEGKLERIQIENAAFKRLLAFFGEYNWHLDERPTRNDREINPDVLGYIFEKYVNQKQMGAYYTKEDITEYIGKSAIIPFIFDVVARKFPSAFSGDSAVWKLLQLDPDRYIYDAVKKSVEIQLPKEIEAGIKDVSKRDGWNKPAREDLALPTETWREVVARRQRYAEVRARLANCGVRDTNDLVTLNLNLRQFIVDVIHDCRNPELLTAFYYTIAGRVPDPEKQSNQEVQPGMSILDLTCGSGAFLFAALNILEPIYEACLSKMREFLDAEAGNPTRKHSHFRRILAEVVNHPNARYFILKSIIVNNLFGVDIMEEAVEICKLRLFLKLAAQVDAEPNKENLGLEPLPDIDFNIRAGNALVGYATRAEVEKSAATDMLRKMALPQIVEDAETTNLAFKLFRQLQTRSGATAQERGQAKSALKQRLTSLENQLNCFLAEDYQLGMSKKKNAFEAWLKSHQPFHWFVEFYGILHGGGFDVIIGNPPYVSAAKVRRDYTVKNLATRECPDIYAWVQERVNTLLRTNGRSGMIVPLSLGFSGDFADIRQLLYAENGLNWFSSFGRIPSALFNFDVRVRNTIHLAKKSREDKANYTTRLHRWFEAARPQLFPTLEYASFKPDLWKGRIPKFNTQRLADAFERRLSASRTTLDAATFPRATRHVLHFKQTAYNWLNFCQELPPCYEGSRRVAHTQFGEICFAEAQNRDLAMLLANGKWLFAFWCAVADDFHVTGWNFGEFPVNLSKLSDSSKESLLGYVAELEKAMEKATQFKLNAGRRVGNYNLAKCRHVTNKTDALFAEALGISEAWEDVELYCVQVVKTDFDDE